MVLDSSATLTDFDIHNSKWELLMQHSATVCAIYWAIVESILLLDITSSHACFFIKAGFSPGYAKTHSVATTESRTGYSLVTFYMDGICI